MKGSCSSLLVALFTVALLASVEGQFSSGGSQSYAYAQASSQSTAMDSGGQQASSFAQAMATAFTSGNQAYARAMASAIIQGMSQRGCQYYRQVVTEARAIAIADGKGNVFTAAFASVRVMNGCWQEYGFGSATYSQAQAFAQAGNVYGNFGSNYGGGRKLLSA